MSLQNHPDIIDRVQTIPFTDFEDLRAIAQMIGAGKGVFGNVGGVVLDEASSMVQLDVDRNWEADSKPKGEPTPVWPDYFKTLASFRQIIAEFSDSHALHVISLAHESDKKNRKGDVIMTFPSFPPSVAKKVKEPMHLVGHMTAKTSIDATTGGPKYEREIQVHPTLKIDAKTRIQSDYVKFNAEWFPDFIAAWLDRGAVVENTTDQKYQDIPEPVTAGMSPEEAQEFATNVANGNVDLDEFLQDIE